jgi:1,4-dihydroxy-2-naphthoyl-CoA synthase
MTVEELVKLGVINKAVPLAQLDEAVGVYVQELLRRPRELLAFTKRVLNRRITDHMSKTLDPALAYQMFGMRQMYAARRGSASGKAE